jgi:choline kinase
MKNDHFYEEKCNFYFLKKDKKKKNIIISDTFFRKKKNKTKVEQKSWVFIIPQNLIIL